MHRNRNPRRIFLVAPQGDPGGNFNRYAMEDDYETEKLGWKGIILAYHVVALCSIRFLGLGRGAQDRRTDADDR
jgi:hypothetical protein